jgi:glycosyltransferase involved in cell wall biosynthesis
MQEPIVTVILFVHAPYAKFLAQSLGSILRQSHSSLEVIVLGDGSVEVERAVEPFSPDPRWKLCSQGSLPFLQATNEKMKGCQGRYIGTWNSDEIYNPDHVKVLVETLEQDREAGAAFDNMEQFGDGAAAAPVEPTLMIPRDRAKALAASRLTVRDIFDDNFMTGPSSLIRKSAIDRVGGYDKEIFLNCDLQWFYRIAAYYPIRFVDYVGVRRRIHPLNNTAVNRHYEFGAKELETIRDKYPDVYQRIGKSVFNKKLGRKYYRLGLYYERRGEISKAREMYKKTMLLRKFSLRYYWEYFRSCAFL